MTLYALIAPSGTPIESTVADDRRVCWSKAFEFLSDSGVGNMHGYNTDGIEMEIDRDLQPEDSGYFRRRFYKRWKASMDYARKWGYRIKEVEVSVIVVI
jgi:hypothetical protein